MEFVVVTVVVVGVDGILGAEAVAAAVSETDFVAKSLLSELLSEDGGSGISICSSHTTPNGASIVTPIRPPKRHKSMMQ
jgi:hypothetical protein